MAKKINIQDFQFQGILGEGSYGKVYRVRKLSQISDENIEGLEKSQDISSPKDNYNNYYALKVIEKKMIKLEEKQYQIHTEKLVLQTLNNP